MRNSKHTARLSRTYLLVAFLFTAHIPCGLSAATSERPATGHWVAASPMAQARLGHAMVELPDGKVMVIGGFDSQPLDVPLVPANPLASCEIYDQATNAWTPAAPHPVAAGWRWAAVLENGMILVAGGATGQYSPIAESHLYDPRKNAWIETGPLPLKTANPHAFMRAIVLENGQVLIAGGEDEHSIAVFLRTGQLLRSRHSYLFTLNESHPASSFWDFTRNRTDGSVSRMPDGRATSALVMLDDGNVLNAGGLGPPFNGSEAATDTALLFSRKSGIWTQIAPMPPVYGLAEDESVSQYPTALGSRWAPFSARLDDGSVLIAGGVGGILFETLRRSALIYDSARMDWRITAPMNLYYGSGNWAAKLGDNNGILFAGPGSPDDGYSLLTLAGEVFDSRNRTWTLVPESGSPPADGTVDSFESKMIALKDGGAQVTGGSDFDTDEIAISGSWIYATKK